MKKLKEYFQLEYLFYLFLVISPFLDSFSYLFRVWNQDAFLSPTTILRLVIPAFLVFFLFIKEKKCRRDLIILGTVYFSYAFFHLLCYQKFLTKSAYGSVFHEAQYIFNYTYMILIFYTCYILAKKGKMRFLYQATTLFLASYVFLLYLALITGTSSSTYIDGVGYKGWNASGNAVGSLLLISLVILLPYFLEKKKWYHFVLVVATGVYLMMFLGTRVGLLGFPFLLFAYLICYLLGRREKKIFSRRTIILSCLIGIAVLAAGVFLVSHSSTLKRQKNLLKEQNEVVDQDKKEVSHITGDALDYIKEIEEGKMDSSFMDLNQQKSLVEMKKFADKIELDNSKRRIQQLVYHTYLVKNQKSLSRILFGNGYLSNYSEMTLEMELLSLLYNFGIFGFVLYLGGFILLEMRALVTLIQNFKRRNTTYLFYLFGVLLVYLLSLMAGYTFFHVSSMVVIVLLHILLSVEQEKVSLKVEKGLDSGGVL